MILSESYKEIMETIHMSEDAHERILANVVKGCTERKKDKVILFHKTARYLTVAAAVLACVIAVPVIYHLQDTAVDKEYNEDVGTDGVLQVENEAVECASAKELSEKVGFPIYDLKKENLPFEADTAEYYAYGGKLAEIEYMGSDGNYAVYRMQEGDEDPSDKYKEYSVQKPISLDSIQITLKGEDEGELYNLAVWTSGGYSYSLYLSDGISEDGFRDILNGIVN